MSNLADYKDRYNCLKLERRDGILQATLHTNGGSLKWSHAGGPHEELAHAFADIASDPENRVVIITGAGEAFSGPASSPDGFPVSSPMDWDVILRNGMRLTHGLLDIDAIVISCVNGPALRHAEIPLLADIVLAAPEATFQDTAHFGNRLTPGDGVNFVFPLLMGLNRGRYFLLTNQTVDAEEAHRLGLVSEIHTREQLLPRAWKLAEDLIKQNPMVLRYTRLMFTQPLKKTALELLGMGLALEGLAAVDESNRILAARRGETG